MAEPALSRIAHLRRADSSGFLAAAASVLDKTNLSATSKEKMTRILSPSSSKAVKFSISGTSWLMAQMAMLEPANAECQNAEDRQALLALVESSFGDLSVIMPALHEVFAEGNHERELEF